ALGPDAPALSLAARLCPKQAAREVWRERRIRRWTDPRGLARQHVGAGVAEHLRAGSAQGHRPRLRLDADSQIEEHRAQADGALRRELFHLTGVFAASAHLLGALAVRQATRPRSGLPRQ